MTPTKRIFDIPNNDDDDDRRGHQSDGRLVPIPDPTKLTTDQLRREIAALREILETRAEGQDKFISTLETTVNQRQSQIDAAAEHLKELLTEKTETLRADVIGKLERHVGETAEKFTGVGAQFSERDTRTDQRAGDTKLAVDAAFAAAKEATSKIELGFTKQIDSMVLAMDTLAKNLDSKINDVKDMINDTKGRMTAIESRSGVIDPSIRNDLVQVMSDVRSLRDTRATIGGATVASDSGMTRLISIIAVISTVAGSVLGWILSRGIIH